MKKLIEKIRERKDKKFLTRLNRVLKNNMIDTSLSVNGDISAKGDIRSNYGK